MTIVFTAFLTILVITLTHRKHSHILSTRSKEEWLLDISGLAMQGIVIPLLQTVALYYLFYFMLPTLHRVLIVPPIISFFLSFVAIDYLYYWNHRILHRRSLWPLHRIHHTAEHIDLLITSRNSLWSPLLLVYLWANGFLIFILNDPTYFILGVSLTAALDLWRHAGFGGEPQFLSRILVTPKLHAWHHSASSASKNFGANFILWDLIHGTYQEATDYPQQLGIPAPMSTARKLFYPFTGDNQR